MLVGRNFDGRIFRPAKLLVGRNFRHFSKNSSLSPDKVSPDKVLKSISNETYLNKHMLFRFLTTSSI